MSKTAGPPRPRGRPRGPGSRVVSFRVPQTVWDDLLAMDYHSPHEPARALFRTLLVGSDGESLLPDPRVVRLERQVSILHDRLAEARRWLRDAWERNSGRAVVVIKRRDRLTIVRCLHPDRVQGAVEKRLHDRAMQIWNRLPIRDAGTDAAE